MTGDIFTPEKPAASRLPLLPIAIWSVIAGLLYAQFHLFGNTTEVASFGHSAFTWMLTLWKSGRIFGGNIYYLGWIMPAISIGLVYLRRREIMMVPRAVYGPALLLVAFALFLHWAGARAQQTRLSLIAFILLIWGIPFFLYGWRLARQLIFPVGLLVFCVPLNFLDALVFPIRILAARMADVIASGLGIAVARAGSVIRLNVPEVVLNGADPASGLGTLLSLCALVLIGGYIRRDRGWLRGVMMVVVAPVMVLAGAIRLVSGVLLSRFISPEIALFVHDMAGHVVMFGLAILMLAGIRRQLIRIRFFQTES